VRPDAGIGTVDIPRIWRAEPAVADQLVGNDGGQVHWDGEADADRLPPPDCPAEFGTVAIAVLTPIIRPPQSTSGPPEFPGLIDASFESATREPAPSFPPEAAGHDGVTSRPNALLFLRWLPFPTRPGAAEPTTGWPTCTASECPKRDRGQRLRTPSNLDDGQVQRDDAPYDCGPLWSAHSLNNASIVPPGTADEIT
jgi:hypothetical protein